jgi:diguanylate cyclase
MIKDYMINSFVLVSFISIVYQVFTNSGLNPNLAAKFRLLSGGIFGLLGIALMTFGIHLPNNLMVDFRNLAIFLSAITGGWISAATTALIISVFRLSFHGINKPSISAIIVMGLLVVLFCTMERFKIRNKLRWLLSIGISEIVTCVAFSLIIDDVKLRQYIMLSYCIGLTCISFVLYYYLGYIDALTQSFRKYKQEAKRDFLTGLNNVRQFDIMFNSIIESAQARNETVSLLYLDIDFFKKVNDTYGHREGDLVLKKLGEILKKACRSIDIISRNGGEEFSIILINCSSTMAAEIAERIRKNVENTVIELSNNQLISITVSIGVACYPDHVSDFNLLRERADMALYEAKRTGRNKVVFSHKKEIII